MYISAWYEQDVGLLREFIHCVMTALAQFRFTLVPSMMTSPRKNLAWMKSMKFT